MAEQKGKQLEVRKVKNISREIKPATERMLWGVSAGICEFNGCTNKLYSHHVTKEKVNLAEKAHIYAFSAGGKRPSLLRFSTKINDIDNLMLICERCHKLIDSEDTDYTAEQLLAMKKEHEQRIANVVTIKPDLQSEIVIFNANIANRAIKISDYAAKSAIIPEHYPAREIPINLSPDLSLYDSEDNYWPIMATHLERQWLQYEQMIRDKHISLFAVAPQPLLFKLGTLINRNYNVDVRQSQGSIDNWKWRCDKQTAKIETQFVEAEDSSAEPIITFELTAKLSKDELRKEFGKGTIYRITSESCSPEIIKSWRDLRAVINEYRNTLNTIREVYGNDVKIKMVPIAPVSVSIEAGRQTMKGDPQITIYDRNYISKAWSEALTLNGKE
ncbi:MAG: SAVED domain-containing protein [Bacteroidaceae bacterium]|nr:SAVED domain-containing protein [Bacteroidaceae bacterium]